MKTRYICLALLASLSTSASAQRVMQVTKTDGSVIEIPVTDVERVSFGEKEAPDAAVVAGLCPDNHHPHKIDMGTAGIWSCCNVGASVPWEYGGYYAWGETAEKTGVYDWSTYVHCDGSSSTCHDIGTDISGTLYDAARANWGAPWRMPTLAECQALVNCTSEWTALNDVNGRKFTGSNGNSIFLPVAGYRADNELRYAGSGGFYWSSALTESSPNRAHDFNFGSGSTHWRNGNRYNGQSVRPVFLEKPVEPDAAVQAGLCPDNRHPHQIDMGTAGIWSCCNVGSSAPWEAGGYYAWGETEEKSVYDWETYQYGYYNYDDDYSHLVNIGSDISGTQYDAATVNWGAPWRMPTLAECQALVNCTPEWTALNDVNGRKFTGSNGNSIFLPAAGYHRTGGLYDAGSYGGYWSSTLHESGPGYAYGLYFSSAGTHWSYGDDRSYGQSVRPVR